MNASKREYEAHLYGRASSDGIWGNGGDVNLFDLQSPPALFKYSLADLSHASDCPFPLGKFNMEMYSLKTIATDAYSAHDELRGLLKMSLEEESKKDEAGWVYMYTNLPELVYGRKTTLLGEEEISSVRCRIKIGITGAHPIDRVVTQQGTCVFHTIILLGLFWTPDIKRADKELKNRLEPYRPIEAIGEEVYFGQPEELLVEILTSLQKSRTPRVLAATLKTKNTIAE
jgi:hypothetical protein